MTEQQYGLYYRYNGIFAAEDEKERVVHGPASKEECNRVMRAKIGANTIALANAYKVREYKNLKSKRQKPFKTS